MNRNVKSKAIFEQLFLFISLILSTLAFGFYYWVFHKVAVKKDLAFLLQEGIENLKSESLFFSSSLLIGYLKAFPLLGVAYLLSCLLFVFYFKRSLGWGFFKVSKAMRLLLVFTAFIFVYNNTLSSYNYFTEQWYFTERMLLLISAIGLYYTPMALSAYLPTLFLSFASFNFPFDSFSITDKMLPFTILTFTLCSSMLYLLTYRWLRIIKFERLWVFGCLIIVCCSYLSPALIKMKIAPHYFDWFLIEDFTLAFRQYLNRGWMLNINPESIEAVKQLLYAFQKPFLFFAFIIELLGVLLFFHWRYSVKILILFIVLNTGIFFLSAIFFWKWIVFNLLLIGYLIWTKPKLNSNYNLSLVGLCVFFSLLSPLFPKLGWYSLPYMLEYEIKVTDINGQEKPIQGKDMAPFDIYFTFSRWNVFNEKQLSNATLEPSDVFLTREMSIAQIKEYQQKKGINKFNANAMMVLEVFLNEYFSNYNNTLKSPHLFIKPKSHIQKESKSPFLFDQEVKSLKIIAQESWFSTVEQRSKEHTLKVLEF